MIMSEAESWVVYVKTVHGKRLLANAVCSRAEWDEMERSRPGYHLLVRDGFRSENEAELVARGTAGDSVRRGYSASTE
jgi:hypothetical protein